MVAEEAEEEASDSLIPTLIQRSKDGGGGYFLIGPEAEARETFSLSLCLGRAQHLQLTAEASTVHPDPFYWRYNLLGMEVTSEMFPGLEADFEAEKATALVRTSRDTLSRFLAAWASSVTIKLCSGSVVVAAADLHLSCLQEAATAAAGGREVNVSRSLDLVSSHNLSVAEDAAGNRPRLEVQLSLAGEEAGDRVTSGRLPDSDMETEAELTETSPPIHLPGENIGKPGLSPAKPRTQTVTPASPPTKISSHKSPVRAEAWVPASPPRHQFTFPQHLAVQCSDKILMHINRSVVNK